MNDAYDGVVTEDHGTALDTDSAEQQFRKFHLTELKRLLQGHLQYRLPSV